MVNIGSVDSSFHMDEVVYYSYFILFVSNIWLSGKHTALAGRSTRDIIYQSMRFGPKMCLFWVSMLRNYIWELFPENSLIL
jgi:hypothetical protein